MELETLIMTALGMLVGVLAYFLKVIHSDVRKNTEEVGRNKGRFEQLNLQISQEREVRQIELKNLQENMQSNFNTISDKMNQLLEKINAK